MPQVSEKAVREQDRCTTCAPCYLFYKSVRPVSKSKQKYQPILAKGETRRARAAVNGERKQRAFGLDNN